jgi:hypothetical protein
MKIRALTISILLAFSAAVLTAAESGSPQIVVNPLTDRVIPQVVDGASWSTGFALVNLEISKTIYWTLEFFSDKGAVDAFNIAGSGAGAKFQGFLDPNNSTFFETAGTGDVLNQGWALIRTYDRAFTDPAATLTNDRIGAIATFRQRIASRPDFEAAVSLSPINETRFILPFSNQNGFSTGLAVLNPDPNNRAAVEVLIYPRTGTFIRQDSFLLEPGSKLVFSLPDRYNESRGLAGSIHVRTTNGAALSALGLRFNPGGAFTSTPPLSVAP